MVTNVTSAKQMIEIAAQRRPQPLSSIWRGHLSDWGQQHWLFPWEHWLRRITGNRSIRNSLTWPSSHVKPWLTVLLVSMGCQEVQLNSAIWRHSPHRWRKIPSLNWWICLQALTNYNSLRVNIRMDESSLGQFGRYLILNSGGPQCSSCANTWSACWISQTSMVFADVEVICSSNSCQQIADLTADNSQKKRVSTWRHLKDKCPVYWDLTAHGSKLRL